MLDKLIALISPFYCLSCNQKGSLLCAACQQSVLEKAPSRCYRCHKSTSQFSVCKNCSNSVKLKRVFVVSPYKGLAKDLTERIKFERAMAGTDDIAEAMADILPIFQENTLVCHVPTAAKRIRIRGYDQSELIAKKLAKQLGLITEQVVIRKRNYRQLGASRQDRIKQAESSFVFNQKFKVKGKTVLIVDDVTTSGATIESVAKILKKAGAKEVNGVVFAQAIL